MNEIVALMILLAVFVLALLALALSFSRLHWLLKLLLIVMSSGFYWLSYYGWNQVQGWPADKVLPEKFMLHAAVIEEPDQQQGVEGQVFFWATNLQTSMPADKPRAYRLSYEQDLHRKLETAQRRMRDGSVQLGTRRPSEGSGLSLQAKRLGEKSQMIEFTDLPDPALPEK